MLLETMNKELAKVFIKNNEITGAFIWKEDNQWAVYIGDVENTTGWKEKGFTRKKDAQEYCDNLNDLIKGLNHD